MLPSPLSKISLDGRTFYVKRDDLIDPLLSGNKYRKLYALLYTSQKKYNTIISYGGTQSNAMLSIAALCQRKEWKFIYYTKPLSSRQKQSTLGNFTKALQLGMSHVELAHDNYRDYIASLQVSLDESSFLLDQGGADVLAKEGIEILAKEIRASHLTTKSLAIPSGTGTTALFLALALPEYKVYTTPSVGDTTYLKKQMQALSALPNNLIFLEPSKKYHFAKPYPEFYEIYQKLLETGIEFDLLYAPLMWKVLLETTSEEICYIHSGGVIGNESMIPRYKKIELV